MLARGRRRALTVHYCAVGSLLREPIYARCFRFWVSFACSSICGKYWRFGKGGSKSGNASAWHSPCTVAECYKALRVLEMKCSGGYAVRVRSWRNARQVRARTADDGGKRAARWRAAKRVVDMRGGYRSRLRVSTPCAWRAQSSARAGGAAGRAGRAIGRPCVVAVKKATTGFYSVRAACRCRRR